MSRTAIWAIAVPFAIFLAWTGKIVYDANTGEVVSLAIKGFDPRDLLSGHYLRYRVEWGGPSCAGTSYGEAHCICLGQEKPAQSVWAGSCEELPEICRTYIRGVCQAGQFDAELERYYFPEEWRGKLVTVPDKATVQVSVTKSGRATVLGLSVADKPLGDWIKSAP